MCRKSNRKAFKTPPGRKPRTAEETTAVTFDLSAAFDTDDPGSYLVLPECISHLFLKMSIYLFPYLFTYSFNLKCNVLLHLS